MEEDREEEDRRQKQPPAKKHKRRTDRWHGFHVVTPSQAVLRGRSSILDKRFKLTSRGRQATAASVVAIVYAHLFEPRDWTATHVDSSVEFGDNLFRVSRARARVDDNTYMTTNLLQQEFFVGDYKCKTCVEPGTVYGSVFTETAGAPVLQEGLRQFLETRNFGVLTSQGVSVAIWSLPPQGHFYFSPTPVDEQGRRSSSPSAAAALIRSTETDCLAQVFLASLNGRLDSRYCIDKVSVMRVRPIGRERFQPCGAAPGKPTGLQADKRLLRALNPVDLEDAKPDCSHRPAPAAQPCAPVSRTPLTIEITNYEVEARFAAVPLAELHVGGDKYSNDGVRVNVPSTFVDLPAEPGAVILHGWTHAASECYNARGLQAATNCVLVFAMKYVHPVRTWLRETVDKVLALGDDLFAEVKAARPHLRVVTSADLSDERLKISGKRLVTGVDLITVTGTIVSKYPTILDVKKGLEEFFDKDNAGGVIECPSLTASIWMEDEYYFYFDSSACDINGVHVASGLTPGVASESKGQAPGKPPTGKSCVIRFVSLAALSAHVFRNIDESQMRERYTIRKVDVQDDVPGIRNWNNFLPGTPGKNWVLRGTTNSAEQFFSEWSRGSQGLAMLLAIAVCLQLTPLEKVMPEDIDDSLREGDNFFNWCLPAAEGADGDDDKPELNLNNMRPFMFYKKRQAVFDIKDTVIIGDFANLDEEVPDMNGAMRKFFDKYEFGLVESVTGILAVWRGTEVLKDGSSEVAYYIYSEKPDWRLAQLVRPGTKTRKWPAAIFRYLDLAEVIHVLKEYLQPPEEGELRTTFFVHELKVRPLGEPLSQEEIEKAKATPVKPDLNAWVALNDASANLSGDFNQMDDRLFRNESRDKQQAACAIVGLAMTQLFDPVLWSPETINDILMIADRLTISNRNNIREDGEEDDENVRDYLLPNELFSDFPIGVNELFIEVEGEFASGGNTDMPATIVQFFDQNKMGVVRSDELMYAMWKINGVMFMFDSRGKLTDTATAYWFLDPMEMGQFIAETLIDREDGVFFIDKINVENNLAEEEQRPELRSDEVPGEEKFYNFVKDLEGSWKIDCNVSITDNTFPEDDRGKQTAAVSVMAIIFSKVYEPRHWSTEILDEVTVTGQKLHERSIQRLGENKSLMPNELVNEFFLSNRRIELHVRDCVEAGTIGGRGPRVQDVRRAIASFFGKCVSGVLTVCNFMNLAVWSHEGCFFYLEPGVVLFRFEKISLLQDRVSTYGHPDDDFTITSVNLIDWNKLPPWKFDPSPAVRPSNLPVLNAYCRLPGRARAILRGFTHQGAEIFGNIRGHQMAANCIVALSMAIIKNPITWTRKTLDEILAIGVNLHRESMKYNVDVNTLRPKNLVRIFHIGVNVLAVDVQEVGTGIVHNPPPEPEEKGAKKKKEKSKKDKKPKGIPKREIPPPPPPILLEDGIVKFFENNHAGVIVTGQYMVSIWKDEGVFFAYDPRPRNSEGLKTDDENSAASCIVWFACMEPFIDLLMANIEDDEQYANYSIYRVIVKTVPIEHLPCPTGYKAFNEKSTSGSVNESECAFPPILPLELRKQPSQLMNVSLESHFERLDKEMSVILGSTHMEARRFHVSNRGHQGTAIACVANALAAVHAPSTWTTEMIDAVIKYGDILHTECAQLLCPGPRNLSPSELLDVFIVGDIRATVRLHRNFTAGITLEEDLNSAFSLFFGRSPFGIWHTAAYSAAVIEHWGKYYVLDPSERNKFKDAFEGAACLIKCDTIRKLVNILLQICDFKEATVYTLSAVHVLDLHFFTH